MTLFEKMVLIHLFSDRNHQPSQEMQRINQICWSTAILFMAAAVTFFIDWHFCAAVLLGLSIFVFLRSTILLFCAFSSPDTCRIGTSLVSVFLFFSIPAAELYLFTSAHGLASALFGIGMAICTLYVVEVLRSRRQKAEKSKAKPQTEAPSQTPANSNAEVQFQRALLARALTAVRVKKD